MSATYNTAFNNSYVSGTVNALSGTYKQVLDMGGNRYACIHLHLQPGLAGVKANALLSVSGSNIVPTPLSASGWFPITGTSFTGSAQDDIAWEITTTARVLRINIDATSTGSGSFDLNVCRK